LKEFQEVEALKQHLSSVQINNVSADALAKGLLLPEEDY
jgi:hypothetical protein